MAHSDKPISPKPRVLALGLFHRDGRVLAARGEDKLKGEVFYRPFGGGVEFGELSGKALEREIHEELGQTIKDVRLLGVVENIFDFEGRTGHEIIFLYDAVFVNEAMYSMNLIQGVEERLDTQLTGSWISVDDVKHGRVLLYPAAIRPLVTALR